MKTVTIEQAQQLNPLIDSDGDAYKVRLALITLACLLEEDPKLEADSHLAIGFAGILRTCGAALEYMDKVINQQ